MLTHNQLNRVLKAKRLEKDYLSRLPKTNTKTPMPKVRKPKAEVGGNIMRNRRIGERRESAKVNTSTSQWESGYNSATGELRVPTVRGDLECVNCGVPISKHKRNCWGWFG